MVAGLADSWKPSIAIPNRDSPYISCAWSPCSQFITAQTQESVEVRDPLTFELLSTLQPTKSTPQLTGSLAYSPSGCSICCASHTTLVIWDIQTGGLVKEIECDASLDNLSSLVWSSDERAIGAVLWEDNTWIVAIYDVASGKTLCETLASVDKPYLWAHNKSFQAMTTQYGESGTRTINIIEVGPALTQIRTFTILVKYEEDFHIGSFSPVSLHISILVPTHGGQSLILGNSNQELLRKEGLSHSHCFSSDGQLFAASLDRDIHIWIYNNDRYNPWRKFPDQSWSFDNLHLQFSPNSSSILGRFGDALQVWHFDDYSTDPVATREQYINVSPNGAYAVTAHHQGNTITITNLISQTPPQFIDVGISISGLALTNNILLVVGLGTIVAWQLMEGGRVRGVSGDRGAGYGDRIWIVQLGMNGGSPHFFAQGQIGFIRRWDQGLFSYVFSYNLVTGETYEDSLELSQSHPWYSLKDTSQGRYHLHCSKLSLQEDPSGDNQPDPQSAFHEGWVKDPEGKRRLWLPVEWRAAAGCVEWSRYIPTLQVKLPGGESVAIGF